MTVEPASEAQGRPVKHWAAVRRLGTVALFLYALLWPLAMLVWVWISWEWGDSVYVWRGDETTDTLPRLREVSKDSIEWLEYLWYTVAAEPAATRW